MKYHQRKWQELMDDDFSLVAKPKKTNFKKKDRDIVELLRDMSWDSPATFPTPRPRMAFEKRLALDRFNALRKHDAEMKETHAAVDAVLSAIPSDIVRRIKTMADIPVVPHPKVLFSSS